MKLLFSLFLSLAVLLLTPVFVYSQEEFRVSIDVEYKIAPDGKTTVTHNVALENLTSEFYAKSYALSLENIEPLNPRATEGSKILKVSRDKADRSTTLRVEFDEAVVGKGSKRFFAVAFDETSFVTKTGEVWEIAIPRLSNEDSFSSYNVSVLIPNAFGKKAYLTPDPVGTVPLTEFTKYYFDKDKVASVGISAGFGEFQVFSFSLKYHLENPLGKSALIDIALPPDTAFQKVYYENIEPRPKNTSTDQDGNWLATYELSARERIDVTADGSVQVYSEPRSDIPKTSSSTLSSNIAPSAYWQTMDPKIVDLAKRLQTPKGIYDYVATTLSYDYARVRPNVERLGASAVLDNPTSAICMEFTDLFIAIARAAGIPAREINGFAYTENPEIEPLSLVADVLHAWPEYWDKDRQVWVPVDPTWGSTTGGIDFFNQLDLRHFVFVIHGADAEKPYPAGSYKLGPNPEKDVFVNFGELPQNRVSKTHIQAEVQNKVPLLPPKVVINLINNGPQSVYNESLEIYFDNKKISQMNIPSLLPFSTYETEISIPYSLLSLGSPEKIRIFAGTSSLEVPTGKIQAILYNLIAIVIIVTLLMLAVLVRLKKLKLPSYAFKIRKNQGSQRSNP